MQPYQPLSKEQYQQARASGFTPERIVEMEQKRKASSEPKRGLGTEIAAGIVKPFARTATSFLRAGEKLTGGAPATPSTPFSGDFLGNVQPLGYAETGEKLAPWEATKDIVGGAAEVGSNFMGLGAAKGGWQALKAGKALTRPTLSAFYQAGKAAAPTFAVASAGQSLQDPSKTLGESAIAAGTGYAAGFGLGGLTGVGGKVLEKTGIPGRIFGGLERSKNVAEAIEREAKIPKITSAKARAQALEISRAPMASVEKQAIEEGGSRIGKEGFLTSAPIAESSQEIPVTEAVQSLVEEGKLKAKMPRNEQLGVIRQRVSQLNQGVKDLVKRFNEPFNTGELVNRLNKAKDSNRILFGNDKTAMDAYDAVIDEYLKYIKKNNISGLLDSRQAFDRYIRESFPKAFQEDILTGAVNPRYQALRDVRGVANNFAADLLTRATGGDAAAQALLNGFRNEHLLLSAADNIALKMKGYGTKGGKILRFADSPKAQGVRGVRKLGGMALTAASGYGLARFLSGD